MNGFVDLHAHALPGVDDGPATPEEAVELLRLAHAGGTRVLAATPHMFSPLFGNRETSSIRQAFADFVGILELLTRRDPETAFLTELELFLGAENFCSPEFLEALENDAVLALNDGRHLLVELGPYLPFGAIEAVLRRVIAAGYFPVVAHVERYPVLWEDRGRLAALVDMGCLLQVNRGAVLRPRFSRARRRVFGLLRTGRVAVVASDGHNTSSRPPHLGEAWDVLCARFGPDRATAWLRDNPRSILGAA